MLLIRLQERFGTPLDSYVNGSQVWLREDGPNGVTFEWRLHPVAGYARPPSLATEEVFSTIAFALANQEAPIAAPESLWDGLECFVAFSEEIEPATLSRAAADALGIAPDASGLVDHGRIGDLWQRSSGGISIVSLLLEELNARP